MELALAIPRFAVILPLVATPTQTAKAPHPLLARVVDVWQVKVLVYLIRQIKMEMVRSVDQRQARASMRIQAAILV